MNLILHLLLWSISLVVAFVPHPYHISSNCCDWSITSSSSSSSISLTSDLNHCRKLSLQRTKLLTVWGGSIILATGHYNHSIPFVSRRNLFLKVASSTVLIPMYTSLLQPSIANGATLQDETDVATTTTNTLSADDVASLLHAVPTFTIVDNDGIPYMVVGEDARVTGYFFTTYNEAQRILQLAKSSVNDSIREQKQAIKKNKIAVEDDDIIINPWQDARISTIPLDVAITLSLKGLNSNVRNYFYVAPAVSDIDDALQITNQTDLVEGKVPLFYYSNFTINGSKIPLYFQKKQLIKAYQKENPNERILPNIQVTELFAVLTEMVHPTTMTINNNNTTTTNDDIQNLIFIPPVDSEKRAKECMKLNKDKSPFVLGKRIIVL